jgi:IclR family pca regulon transcriptional regulator
MQEKTTRKIDYAADDAGANASASTNGPRDRRDYVTALARGIEVMRAFDCQNEHMTLTEVSQIVKLPRATVRRSLTTLKALGYVEDDGKFFRLAPKILTLARAYLSSNMLPRVAHPFLERMSEQLGEPCSVSILHDHEIIYVGRSSNKRLAALIADVGARRPAYCTSMGRVLLSTYTDKQLAGYFKQVELKPLTKFTVVGETRLREILAKVRQQEFCLSDQETEVDLRTIAVPLRNASGRIIASLHVATQASRTTKRKMIERFLPVLRRTAAEMRVLLV